MQEVKTRIKNFLSEFFGDRQLQDDEDIFALGFINSMFAMQLVLFIEKEFQVQIEDDELDFENFRTIDAMVSLLDRKTVLLTGN
jgi:methoxymalonate biosynthesis acyl carrier protein